MRAITNDAATTAQFHIRAITRDPSKAAAARALAEKGIDVLKVYISSKVASLGLFVPVFGTIGN